MCLSQAAFALDDGGRAALATPSATKPPAKIIRHEDGTLSVQTNNIKSDLKSYWEFMDISVLIGQMLHLARAENLEYTDSLLRPLIREHLAVRETSGLTAGPCMLVETLIEVRRGGELVGYAINVDHNGSLYSLIYSPTPDPDSAWLPCDEDGDHVYVRAFREHDDARLIERAGIAIRRIKHGEKAVFKPLSDFVFGLYELLDDVEHSEYPSIRELKNPVEEFCDALISFKRDIVDIYGQASKNNTMTRAEAIEIVAALKRLRFQAHAMAGKAAHAVQTLPGEALREKRRKFNGHMRDAIEILESCYSFVMGDSRPRPHMIVPIIADMAELLHKRHEDEGCAVEVINELAATTRVPGNRLSIKSALYNIINNGLFFARENKQKHPEGDDALVTIRLSEEAGFVRIEIANNGAPIDESLLLTDPLSGRPRIFTLNTSKRDGGSGLGDAEAWIVTKDLGGTITVENTKDGPRFTILLPRADSTEGHVTVPSVGSTEGHANEAILRAHEALSAGRVSETEAAEIILEGLRTMEDAEWVVNMQTAVDMLRAANIADHEPILAILERYAPLHDHTGLRDAISDALDTTRTMPAIVTKLNALSRRSSRIYGLQGGTLSSDKLLFAEGVSTALIRHGMPHADADRLSQTFARMKAESLKILSITGVITDRERLVLNQKTPDCLIGVTETEWRSLAQRLKELIRSYDTELTARTRKIMMTRLVPLWIFKPLAEYYELGRSQLAQIIQSHPDFPAWLAQARLKVDEIKDRTGGRSNAWRIVHSQGIQKVDDWVRGAEAKVAGIQQQVGGATNAWNFILRHGLEGIDDWLAGARTRVDEIADRVHGESNAWSIVGRLKPSRVTQWVREAEVIVAKIAPRVNGLANAWGIVTNHALPEVESWVDEAVAKVDEIQARVGGTGNAWKILRSHGLDGVDHWIARAEADVTRLENKVMGRRNAWAIIIVHGLENTKTWLPLAEEKVALILGRVGSASRAWQIVIGRKLDEVIPWVTRAEAIVQRISDRVGGQTMAWNIVIEQGIENIDEWLDNAESIVQRLSPHVGGVYNAWFIVVAQGISRAEDWAESAEPKVAAIALKTGRGKAWGIVINQGIDKAEAWVATAQPIVSRILPVVKTRENAWDVVMRQGASQAESWTQRALEKLPQLLPIVKAEGLAWFIMIAQGLEKTDAWLTAAQPVVDRLMERGINEWNAWFIVIGHTPQSAESWATKAEEKVTALIPRVHSATNAWEIVIRQGLANADVWARKAETRVREMMQAGQHTEATAWRYCIRNGLEAENGETHRPPKGTPGTLLRYMYENGVFTHPGPGELGPQLQKEMARKRGGNDSPSTISLEVHYLRQIGLIEGASGKPLTLPAWLRGIGKDRFEELLASLEALNEDNAAPNEMELLVAKERIRSLRRELAPDEIEGPAEAGKVLKPTYLAALYNTVAVPTFEEMLFKMQVEAECSIRILINHPPLTALGLPQQLARLNARVTDALTGEETQTLKGDIRRAVLREYEELAETVITMKEYLDGHRERIGRLFDYKYETRRYIESLRRKLGSHRMNIIERHAGSLEQRFGPERATAAMNAVHSHYDRMDALLAFASRFLRGVTAVSRGDLDACIRETVAQVTKEAGGGKTVTITTPHDTRLTDVPFDPLYAQFLVAELVRNALKEKPVTTVRVSYTYEQASGLFTLVVSDDGSGIDERLLERAGPGERQELFKYNITTANSGGSGRIGTGLGLAFVYELMDRLKGSIEAANASAPAHGAVFTTSFPLKDIAFAPIGDHHVEAMHPKDRHALWPADTTGELSITINASPDLPSAAHNPQQIKARVHYHDKDYGVDMRGNPLWMIVDMKRVPETRPGLHRFAIRAPVDFEGDYTFMYSVDGGLTWLPTSPFGEDRTILRHDGPSLAPGEVTAGIRIPQPDHGKLRSQIMSRVRRDGRYAPPNAPGTMTDGTEEARVHSLRAAVTYIQDERNSNQPIILALGRNWMRTYHRGGALFRQLNLLMIRLRAFLRGQRIALVDADDENLLDAIVKQQGEDGWEGAKVVALASLPDPTQEGGSVIDTLREALPGSFIIGIDDAHLEPGQEYYTRLPEVLDLALRLAFDVPYDPNPNIGVDKNRHPFPVLIPKAEPIPQEELERFKQFYIVQANA